MAIMANSNLIQDRLAGKIAQNVLGKSPNILGLPILHLCSSTMENRVSTHRFNYSGHGEWVRVLNTKLFEFVLQ